MGQPVALQHIRLPVPSDQHSKNTASFGTGPPRTLNRQSKTAIVAAISNNRISFTGKRPLFNLLMLLDTLLVIDQPSKVKGEKIGIAFSLRVSELATYL